MRASVRLSPHLWQHDKPHMLVEYDSISSVNIARSLDRPDLQVIRAANNDGLIRKFKELTRRTRTRTPSRTRQPSKGSRYRSLSPLSTTHSSRRRLPPRGLESRWKNDRYHSSESEPESRCVSIPVKNSAPTFLRTQVESGSKDKPAQATSKDKESSVLTKIDLPKVSPILRIPYVGEIIQLDLNQLEENPVGIIIMLTAAEASQQLWMIVAAHYNSKKNVESARKVLEAGIDVSVRLGRTDTKPFWYLLDQINRTSVVPSNKECSGSVFPTSRSTIPSCSLRLPEGPRNAISPVKKGVSPEIQSQLNKLQEENKALRSKLASVMDDLSEVRIGKRRAEEEMKEERAVRRKLESDLKHSEDSLRRSKRMEETALEHIKREVESRRKTEALLANNEKTQQQQQPQQDLLLQLKYLLQNVSHRDSASTV
ncbi:hypothetical protein Clacol_000397 [Clathrus columnatus]|uniref:Uncharacterized protein n=1 Tax=Clathrus columnatus TaxID=1419009 RepID=A0AAV5A0R7_9AGAM|nr:hypothetical protein Clacol_000397 [Clathrus columnatus]